MWILLVILALIILVAVELNRQLPRCEGWKNLLFCLDLNHNPIHWVRCAILAIVVSLIIIFVLNKVSLYNFLLVFLVVFVGSYFSSNWVSAHYQRNIDYKIEPYIQNLRRRM